MPGPDHPVPRGVFGRRRGKPLSPSRRHLVDRMLPALSIVLPPDAGDIDPKSWFAEPIASVWLEIGFGKGEHLAWQAAHNPDVGIIGCEPFETGVAGLLTELEAGGQQNVRVLVDDATPLLAALAPGGLDRVFLLFPDPWPKSRHHKRRFVNHDRLDLLARAMADGAELRIATDHPGYLAWILKYMVARSDFEWLAEGPADWRARPPDWPATRYETKAVDAGIRPTYLRYRRRAKAAAELSD